jgi:putative ABC transport system permease protein
MFRTRTIKIIRDITARRTRTLLVSLSVFVGVLAVVVLTTLGQIITRQLEKDLIPDETAMLRIFVSPNQGETVDPEAALATLRAYPGVTVVEGQAVYEFEWKLPGDEEFSTGQLYAYSEPFDQIKLEPVRLLDGRYPVDGQNEIAIEQRMADAQHLKLGDTLVVRVNGSSEAEMRIVGLVYQPYLYIGGGDGSVSAYATYADAQNIVRFQGFSSIYARFKNFATAREQSHAFRKALMDQTPYTIVFYLVNDPDNNLFLVGVRQFSQVLVILALVAMAVASVLVITVIGTVVSEQRFQIGAMKALGAGRSDILRIYLGISFVYGLIGTLPAIVLGVPAGQAAARAAAPLANTILENTSPPLIAIVAGIALGLAVPVLSAVLPVYNGSRITIREAMTDQGLASNYGRGVLPTLVRKLPPLPLWLRQALNNVFRRKARLTLTLFTLTLAVAAFMGCFAVFQTLNKVVGQVETTLNYQISVDVSDIEVMDIVQSLLMDVKEQIREVKPGVAVQLTVDLTEVPEEQAEGAPPSNAERDITDFYVTGIDTTTDLLDLTYVAGYGWINDPERGGIVITPHMAEAFDKTVGDMLHLIGPEHTADFEIIGIAEFPLETAFMEWHQLADFVGVIHDAPIPNAYWESLSVEWKNSNENTPEDNTVWALGVDERAGQLFTRDFSADVPGVIISQTLAQAGGFVEGGTITLRPSDGSLLGGLVDDTSITYPILKIVPIKTMELRVFARDLPEAVLQTDKPLLIAMHWAQLASLVHLDYRAITPETFYIDLVNPEESTNRLNGLYSPPMPVYQNQVGFENRVAQTILSLGLVMSLAAVLMALVGGIGLLTITSMGVFERQREIGVMRSVGASSWAIIQQFLLEGVLVGLIAWGIGLPLSFLFGEFLIDMVPFGGVIVLRYTLVAPLMGFGGMLLVTVAATLYPALTAAHKTVSDILRYQ